MISVSYSDDYYNNQCYQRDYSHNSHSSTIKPYVEAKITSSNFDLEYKDYLFVVIYYLYTQTC